MRGVVAERRREARGQGGGQEETGATGHTRDRWRASLRLRVCTRRGIVPRAPLLPT